MIHAILITILTEKVDGKSIHLVPACTIPIFLRFAGNSAEDDLARHPHCGGVQSVLIRLIVDPIAIATPRMGTML
jgi:hypothetical protein